MTQLIENTPRRHALIATLSHFDDPTRVVVLSDQRESKDLFWLRRRAHRLTFLIDRGYRLEIDLTNSESARSTFLIVAESRFSFFVLMNRLRIDFGVEVGDELIQGAGAQVAFGAMAHGDGAGFGFFAADDQHGGDFFQLGVADFC